MSLIVRAGMTMVALSLASGAAAVDGVLEINQVCASGTGCFPGDTAGFPVEISNGGSYRLTSNLTPPNPNTTAISITISAGTVNVDLNGFAIQGPNGYAGPGSTCSAPGTGVGVVSVVRRVSVTNGHVRGMGSDGIVLTNTAHVERIVAEQNCGDGVRVGIGALVIDTIARLNFRDGIEGGSATVVTNSVAERNGGNGIIGSEDITVDGCIASSNGVDGVFGGTGSRIRGCLTVDNGDDGIETSGTAGSAQVIESIANENSDRGITGSMPALGFNVVTGNSMDDLSGLLIGCNLVTTSQVGCPQ